MSSPAAAPERGPIAESRDRRLPDGFRARLAGDAQRLSSGVLVGGSPLTSMRLSERAQKVVDDPVVRDAASAAVLRRLLDANLADPVLDEPACDESVGGADCEAGDLTVIIPTRDRADQVERALQSLRAGAAGGAEPAVIVVDDASLQPAVLADVAGRYGANLLRLEENVGPAGARNAGLARARTPYVAFVDSDVTVSTEELLDLARHFRDPTVALVGPLVQARPRSTTPRWFERYDAYASSLSLGHIGGVVRPGARVAWLPSACLVARRDRLGAGFDASMRVGEDVDLVWRLVDGGQRVRYDPSIVAAHDTRTSVRGWLGRKVVYGSGSALLARRHGSAVAPAAMTPTMAVAALAVLHRRAWAIPVAALAVVDAQRRLVAGLPAGDATASTAWRLAATSLGWALRQESGLTLRHWWPLAALLAPVSPAARRVIVSAVLVDLAVDLAVDGPARPRGASRPGVLLRFAGRRLDDLAYGSGLWLGSLRHRTGAALRVRWLGRS